MALERLRDHRVLAHDIADVCEGEVRWSAVKSLFFLSMMVAGSIGGALTFSWGAVLVFLLSTGIVLLFGHSLGCHRKLVHDSFQCSQWLAYLLVYLGAQVGIAGPIGLLRQHDLRDYAQRLPVCHDYLRHGRSFWLDAWWQLNCELVLNNPPAIRVEPGITADRFYRFLERTWLVQWMPWAVVAYLVGGWGYVFWGVCLRVSASVFGHWMIGYLAHNHGAMVHEVRGAAVQGRNVSFASLLTMGESWHNNHHAYPGSAKLGLYPGEWDPGWWVLKTLERVGLVDSIRLPADLPYRAELIVLPQPSGGSAGQPSAPPCAALASDHR